MDDKKLTKICPICGVEFGPRRNKAGSQLKRRFYEKTTCSIACGRAWQKTKKPRRLCVVCGAVFPDRACRSQTCGSVDCASYFMLHPELTDHSRIQKNRTKPKSTRRNPPKAYNAKFEETLRRTTIKSFQAFKLPRIVLNPSKCISDKAWKSGEDVRGIDSNPDSFWSFVSRKTALLRHIEHKAGAAGLVITLKHRNDTVHRIIQEDLLKNSGNESLCNVFYAWRCTCPLNTEVIYEFYTDLPNEPGWHDACEYCGSCPIEVLSYDT